MSWTTERKESLRALWLEGISSRRIAEILGDVSRNAVMGMVDRMGLMGSAQHNEKLAGKLHGACRPKQIEAGSETSPSAESTREVVVVDPPIMRDAIAPPAESVDDAAVSPAVVIPVPTEPQPQMPPINPASPTEAVQDDAGPQSTTTPVVETVSVPELPSVETASVTVPDTAVDVPTASRSIAVAPRSTRSLLMRTPLTSARKPTPVASTPDVIRVATDGSRPADWMTVVTLVEEMTGSPYSSSRKGHRSALVAMATVIARGDPRRILVPFMSEPQIIAVMRVLAEKGIIVGGKTPAEWMDPDHGDTSFMIDMMVAEGHLDPKARKSNLAEAA